MSQDEAAHERMSRDTGNIGVEENDTGIDINGIEANVTTENVPYIDLCERYHQCRKSSDLLERFNSVIVPFNFDLIPEATADICPVTPSDPNSDPCDKTGCDSDSAFLLNFVSTYVNGLWDWICDHSASFRAGIPCWTADFKAKMRSCVTGVTEVAQFLKCSRRVPRTVMTCSEEDGRFVNSFNSYNVALFEQYFGPIN